MSSTSLSQQLQALAESYRETITLIQELQKFPYATSPLSDDLDQQRLDLANYCHESLRRAEDSLESLRQGVEDYDTRGQNRRRFSSTRDEELERNVTAVERLSDDVKHARGAFRRAQLQSKKSLDARKQKDREQLFANRRNGPNGSAHVAHGRSKGSEKLTQDELAKSAADDVTRALKRTHALMSSNLQQSQFAQLTLEESQEQLKGLSESYTGTTDILQKSRGLVKTLVTSQKSDTWYLQTSVYILFATIGWLVFRRLLYGPLWWLVWVPLKLLWWGITLIFGGIYAAKDALAVRNSTLAQSSSIAPSNTPLVEWSHQVVPSKGAGRGSNTDPEVEEPPSPEMVEEVKKMIKEAGVDIVLEDSDKPRNPKKRMMEQEGEQAVLRDEL